MVHTEIALNQFNIKTKLLELKYGIRNSNLKYCSAIFFFSREVPEKATGADSQGLYSEKYFCEVKDKVSYHHNYKEILRLYLKKALQTEVGNCVIPTNLCSHWLQMI